MVLAVGVVALVVRLAAGAVQSVIPVYSVYIPASVRRQSRRFVRVGPLPPTKTMDESTLKLFEEWGIKWIIENYGWDKDTTPEEFRQADSYWEMHDAYMAGINEAWGWDKL